MKIYLLYTEDNINSIPNLVKLIISTQTTMDFFLLLLQLLRFRFQIKDNGKTL